MQVRERFDRALSELRDDILLMGSRVEQELRLALVALEKLDTDMAHEVFEADKLVNRERFAIEEKCFMLIATQQPAARDLRAIITATNMIVDLERMGDQAKGIAKVIPHLLKYPSQERPPELKEMGVQVATMLKQAMLAYANNSIDVARMVAAQDDEVDELYGKVFTQVMAQMAEFQNPDRVEAAYELLRAARELERFGDLATNIAERTIYLITGSMDEINVDVDDAAEEPRGG
ncbi:MAG: phosphate signaling complex protein PhoU [Caldilineaceae bacterium]|nr:phosphate signaling complex protein PhoU [Caldilineaceae bacterium]